jgi:hypothetical protein
MGVYAWVIKTCTICLPTNTTCVKKDTTRRENKCMQDDGRCKLPTRGAAEDRKTRASDQIFKSTTPVYVVILSPCRLEVQTGSSLHPVHPSARWHTVHTVCGVHSPIPPPIPLIPSPTISPRIIWSIWCPTLPVSFCCALPCWRHKSRGGGSGGSRHMSARRRVDS